MASTCCSQLRPSPSNSFTRSLRITRFGRRSVHTFVELVEAAKFVEVVEVAIDSSRDGG